LKKIEESVEKREFSRKIRNRHQYKYLI